jgi:hypothetical protein
VFSGTDSPISGFRIPEIRDTFYFRNFGDSEIDPETLFSETALRSRYPGISNGGFRGFREISGTLLHKLTKISKFRKFRNPDLTLCVLFDLYSVAKK